ncbi:CHASE domain-containing protein [Colwellia sp. E2M01]|uniref:CHASE domain-containing protein n=1 Tax=Colwellia sp. E2M01 TaxID=2841561 RepID=UPI001C095922|nr:CHASE domain-containing protein [Colwellia sp. E2M01]MBU2871333.1 CHASE domain-containing protein [Colwellia sp. E2M01]
MKTLFLVFISFLVHFTLVKLGSYYTIAFGFASLIWPVTGVVLGLYLLYGRAVLIGVFLSLLFTTYQQQLDNPIPSYLIAILVIISILQLVISKQFVLRCFTFPIKIYLPNERIKFLVLTGPLSALISSTLLALSLWLTLDIPFEQLCYIWSVKWFGDFLSILFITPTLLFIVKNKYVKEAKHQTPAIVTSLCVYCIIAFIFNLSSSHKHSEKEQEFINSTSHFIESFQIIQTSIKHHLISLDALLQASDNVTRAEFKSFTHTIEQSNIEIRALAWLPVISAHKREAFELSLMNDGFNNSYIKKLTAQGFKKAPQQSSYIPITFIEPLESNKAAIGLDVSTHPFVKASVEKAIALKKIVITPLLSLIQQQDKYTGVVVYYPVYKNGTENKETSLKGLVEAVFELDVLLAAIYKEVDATNFTYQLSYAKDNVFSHVNHEANKLFNYTVEVDLFDKKGLLTFSSTERFERGLIDWGNLIITFASCLIGLICVMFVFFIITFNYSLTRKVKQSTAELIKSNNELVVANKAKNLFLANISHEYRTPLNAIIGFTEIAQRETRDKIANDYLNKIGHSSNLLLSIVNDVLDISKMQTGELNLENRAFNPTKESLSVIDMLNDKAVEKSINITKNFTTNFNLWVAGDDFRFKQILINLLNNAIKFTDTGTITISGDCKNTKNNSRIVTLTVTDSGIGIKTEQQKNIFNAFAQAELSTTRKYGGTGLGLSIVKKLSNLMGGDVTLNSEYGKGSSFIVTLELPQATQPVEVPEPKNLTTLQDFNDHGINILVVEDNKINQIIVKKQLSSLGVSCDLVNDGQEALTYLENNKPKLILMDLQMPVMDGFTASKLIKRNNKLKDIPIIILSASVGKEDKEQALEIGIEDFINKPFQQSDLHYVLHKYLSAD